MVSCRYFPTTIYFSVAHSMRVVIFENGWADMRWNRVAHSTYGVLWPIPRTQPPSALHCGLFVYNGLHSKALTGGNPFQRPPIYGPGLDKADVVWACSRSHRPKPPRRETLNPGTQWHNHHPIVGEFRGIPPRFFF